MTAPVGLQPVTDIECLQGPVLRLAHLDNDDTTGHLLLLASRLEVLHDNHAADLTVGSEQPGVFVDGKARCIRGGDHVVRVRDRDRRGFGHFGVPVELDELALEIHRWPIVGRFRPEYAIRSGPGYAADDEHFFLPPAVGIHPGDLDLVSAHGIDGMD